MKQIQVLGKFFDFPDDIKTIVINEEGYVLGTNSTHVWIEKSSSNIINEYWLAGLTHNLDTEDIYFDSFGKIDLQEIKINWRLFCLKIE